MNIKFPHFVTNKHKKKKRKTSKKYLSYNEREQWLNEMISTFGRITTH